MALLLVLGSLVMLVLREPAGNRLSLRARPQETKRAENLKNLLKNITRRYRAPGSAHGKRSWLLYATGLLVLLPFSLWQLGRLVALPARMQDTLLLSAIVFAGSAALPGWLAGAGIIAWSLLEWESVHTFWLLIAGMGCFSADWLLHRRRTYSSGSLLTGSLAGIVCTIGSGCPAVAAGWLANLSIAANRKVLDDVRQKTRHLTLAAEDMVPFLLALGLRFDRTTGYGLLVFGILPVTLAALCAWLQDRRDTATGQFSARLSRFLPLGAEAWALAALAFPSTELAVSVAGSLSLMPLVEFFLSRKSVGQSGQATVRRRRVLLALARYEPALGNLAACFAGSGTSAMPEDQETILHAVHINVQTGEQSGADSTVLAEDILVRSVAAANQERIRLIPSFTPSTSLETGLIRSARELDSEVVVLGWPAQNSTGTSIRERLLDQLDSAVVESRHPAKLLKARRLLFCVPGRLLHGLKARGLADGVSGLLARSGVNSLEVLTLESDAATVKAMLEAGLPVESVRSFANWRELESSLQSSLGAQTGLLVVGFRPDDPDRDPRWLPQPMALAKLVPEPGLALLYPATAGQSAGTETSPAGTPETASPTSHTDSNGGLPDRAKPEGTRLIHKARQAGQIISAMNETSLIDAVHKLTQRVFPDNRLLARRLAGELFEGARVAPIEFEAGVLLLHAHVEQVPEPTVAIGSSRQGWKLTLLPHPIMVVIILCSPAGASPQVHLDALAELAGALQQGDFIKELYPK